MCPPVEEVPGRVRVGDTECKIRVCLAEIEITARK